MDEELILEPDESYEIREHDQALLVHNSDGSTVAYAFNLYYIDQTEIPPRIFLLLDIGNGDWEELELDEGETFCINDDGHLEIYLHGELCRTVRAEDFYEDPDSGKIFIFEDDLEIIADDDDDDDPYGLFEDLPYEN